MILKRVYFLQLFLFVGSQLSEELPWWFSNLVIDLFSNLIWTSYLHLYISQILFAFLFSSNHSLIHLIYLFAHNVQEFLDIWSKILPKLFKFFWIRIFLISCHLKISLELTIKFTQFLPNLFNLLIYWLRRG